MVGGGMGRTHNKEQSFPRAADHLGFVAKDDVFELMKCIVAAQRDHGNREVRMNARMKYLVHNLGIDGFRGLVEGYFGKPIEPWRPMQEWKYMDWMGWHEQGDGKLFLGVSVENGRIRNFENGPQLKTALRRIVDEYNLSMVMSPAQSVIFKDIRPEDKAGIESILAENQVAPVESFDPITRHAMACPALPLCGLAITEAERTLPELTRKLHGLLEGMGLGEEQIITRMTGCPNGCARPYMAELAFVGDGANSYQVWLGGSPVLTRTAYALKDKVKMPEMEAFLAPIFRMYKEERQDGEAFGDWTWRVGKEGLLTKLA
jgi:sulfite reductase (ferredoxin)